MYKRLAVQICPRAPFLVPRNLLQGLRPVSRCLHVKKKVSGRERFQRFTAPSQLKSAVRNTHPQLDALREALNRNIWIDVESLYPQIPPSILTHRDSFRIVRLLHTTLRTNGPGNDAAGAEAKQHLLLATDQLVDLYKSRVLPPHSGASLHLLSIYKENKESQKTRDLWHWLSTQEGDEYVSQAVYGAAIEALAYAGEPLAELETLYENALIQYPGNFASYHLSPEAVVPDRGHPSFSKNLPISLLQGIFTARVLNGDWRSAYLAFDVVLRLMPDNVPRRFFDLIVSQRPFAEAVHVFQLAASLNANSKKNAAMLLRRAGNAAELASTQQRIDAAVDAIGILEAEIFSQRSLLSAQVNQVIKILASSAWEAILCEDEAMKQFNIEIAECGSRLVRLCSPYIAGDLGSTMNSMLCLAGKTRHKELLVEVIETIETLNTWNEVTHRALITCMGMSGDSDGLADAWQRLVKRAGQESRELSHRDWLCLAGAVKYIDSPAAVAFATEQLALHKFSPHFQTKLREVWTLTPGTDKQGRQHTGKTSSSFIRTLKTALDNLESRISRSIITPVYKRHSFLQKGANTLTCDLPEGSTPSNAQIVYNELTVDALQPLPTHVEAHVSKTGESFDTLRFNHWMVINNLLLLSEGFEKSEKEAFEEAIAGRFPLNFNQDQASLDLYRVVSFPTDLEEYRLRILELRGRFK